MKTLFDTDQNGFIGEMHRTDGHTCMDCRYRERWELNQYSQKVVQCCSLQQSKKSNSGYKTIKVTNPACGLWSPISKQLQDEI